MKNEKLRFGPSINGLCGGEKKEKKAAKRKSCLINQKCFSIIFLHNKAGWEGKAQGCRMSCRGDYRNSFKSGDLNFLIKKVLKLRRKEENQSLNGETYCR